MQRWQRIKLILTHWCVCRLTAGVENVLRPLMCTDSACICQGGTSLPFSLLHVQAGQSPDALIAGMDVTMEERNGHLIIASSGGLSTCVVHRMYRLGGMGQLRQ